MKKMGAALCLSSALLACAPVQAGWQGNWLLGASGGYFDRNGDLIITQVGALGSQSIIRQGYEDTGWLLSLLGGYQIRCNQWLLGAELNVDWYDINEDNDNNLAFTTVEGPIAQFGWNANFTYKRDWVVGLTGRLGYEVAPYLLPYIRLGAEWSRDKLTYSQAINAAIIPAVGNFVGTFSDEENSVRVVAGLGFEIPVPKYNCFTIRAEYDFHSRGQRVDAVGQMVTDGEVFLVNASRKPYTQTGIVSVVWNI
ncbi:MAG: outer membrane beta-barrel protein [Proteobacteria bacterium]|nr:outer membrane beta-barrel protein [Pseudomonadota bacterium]